MKYNIFLYIGLLVIGITLSLMNVTNPIAISVIVLLAGITNIIGFMEGRNSK